MGVTLRSAPSPSAVPESARPLRAEVRIRCDADIAILDVALDLFGFTVIGWRDLDARPHGPGEWRIEVTYVNGPAVPPESGVVRSTPRARPTE